MDRPTREPWGSRSVWSSGFEAKALTFGGLIRAHALAVSGSALGLGFVADQGAACSEYGQRRVARRALRARGAEAGADGKHRSAPAPHPHAYYPRISSNITARAAVPRCLAS